MDTKERISAVVNTYNAEKYLDEVLAAPTSTNLNYPA